jgi:hypothetical protein
VVFAVDGQPVVSMDRKADGAIVLLVDIKSQDGRIIARLNSDGFVINRNNYLSMRKDKSSLEIEDEYGNEVLHVHYLNRQAISFDGTIQLADAKIPLRNDNFRGNCSWHSGIPDFAAKIIRTPITPAPPANVKQPDVPK